MIEPQVYLVSRTEMNRYGIDRYLEVIGTKWNTNDQVSDGENLVELAGRMCYLSFEPELNPNVKKIREGNKTYIKNILNSAHGSCVEHVNFGFIFHNVSRVFTHELVRHRIASYSQESLRYVRLDKGIKFWISDKIKTLLGDKAVKIVEDEILHQQETYKKLLEITKIEELKDFNIKKTITSFLRRIVGMGMSTTIMMTANVRTWRWLIELRTHSSAEEEIRIVFQDVANILKNECPNLFQDMIIESDGWYHFENRKI